MLAGRLMLGFMVALGRTPRQSWGWEVWMRVQLEAFPHEPGQHCSSTSLRSVLAYDGIVLPEAVIFGLGSGAGFLYWRHSSRSPTHRFNGRAPDLEGKFYRNLGHALEWAGRWDPEGHARASGGGRPVRAQADLQPLPYYEPVHFPGHGVVVVGVDLAAGTATLADVASPTLQTVPLERLRAALSVAAPPMLAPYRWAAAPRVEVRLEPEVFRRAIRVAARGMLEPEDPEREGLGAMRQLVADLPAWGEAPDWAWCARFAYQSIEKRGTGGGNFRLLYAAFLEAAARYLPELAGLEAARRMRAVGWLWQEVARLFKRIFVEQDPTGFGRVAARMREVWEAERRVWEDLAAVGAAG